MIDVAPAKVGVVIVCMNNLKNLFPCLNSIKKHTRVSYEIWVTCYMFSEENLKRVRENFPEVHLIVNNEIAGFSENNNLILKQLQTEYALILNDDTEIHDSMIDKLCSDLDANPNVSVVSPVLYSSDGSVLYCGRNPISAFDFILSDMSICNREFRPSKFINQNGFFQTFNVSGACFLVRTKIMEQMGFFDETYFFCPEDIAFSTKLNESGYQCWVDTDVGVTHHCGKTRTSKVKMAVLPALRKGSAIYWGRDNLLKTFILEIAICVFSVIKTVYFFIKQNEIDCLAQWNCVKSIFSKKSTKQIFTHYYLKIR